MARHKATYTGERLTSGVRFMLTPSERAQVDAAATAAGMRISDYCRARILRQGRGAKPNGRPVKAAARDLGVLNRELNALGNNLNQITHHMHATGELRHWPEIRRVVALLERAIAHVVEL